MRARWMAALSISLAACGGEDPVTVDAPPAGLTLASQVSDCGGFAKPAGPAAVPLAYCDAEVLSFTYAGDTLSLANDRVVLNCCGDHSVDVTFEDGTYVVTEVDAPQASAGGARCDCMCVFDFEVDAGPIAAGTIPVRLVRDVTDVATGPVVAWEGELDLTAGSGEVTVDATSAYPWCP